MGKTTRVRKADRGRGKPYRVVASAGLLSPRKNAGNAFQVLEAILPPPSSLNSSATPSPEPFTPDTPACALTPTPKPPCVNLREDEWWDDDEKFYPAYTGPPRPMQPVIIECPQLYPHNLHVLGCIGMGAYGKVFAAEDTSFRLLHCVKVFDKNRVARLNSVAGVKQELESYKRMLEHRRSPFLLEASASFENPHYLFIAMPLMACDLQTMVGQHVPDEYLSKYILQAALGLDALHNMGIIHCDIKPANILLDAHGNVRLADFGLAYIHSTAPPSRDSPMKELFPFGTPEFVAPEAFMPGCTYNQMIDYWALGVTFFVLLTGNYPFQTHSQLMDYCTNPPIDTVLHWMVEHGLDFTTADAVSKLLEIDPAKRYTCDELGFCLYFDAIAYKLANWKADIENAVTSMLYHPNGLPQYAPCGDTSLSYRPSCNCGQSLPVKLGWDEEDAQLLGDFNWVNPRGAWAKNDHSAVNSP